MSNTGQGGKEKKSSSGKEKDSNYTSPHLTLISMEKKREEDITATNEATLGELREILKDVEKDTWQFVKPRTQL